jgi:hypothetical protein
MLLGGLKYVMVIASDREIIYSASVKGRFLLKE